MKELPSDHEMRAGGEAMEDMAEAEDMISHGDALEDFATIRKVGGDEIGKLVERIRSDIEEVFEDALRQANALVRLMGAENPFEDVPGITVLNKDFSKAQRAVDHVKRHVHRMFHATAGKAFRWLQRRSWWKTIPNFLAIIIINSLVCGGLRVVVKKARVDGLMVEINGVLKNLGKMVSSSLDALPGGRWLHNIVLSLWLIIIGIAEIPLRSIAAKATEKFDAIRDDHRHAIQRLQSKWCPSASRTSERVKAGARLAADTVDSIASELQRSFRNASSTTVARPFVELMPSQEQIVNYALEAPDSGLLNANPAGTGKTLTALATVLNLRRDAVIVVPNGLQSVWSREIRKWCAGDLHATRPTSLSTLRHSLPRAAPDAPFRCAIIDYDTFETFSIDDVAKLRDHLARGTLVLDECHHLPKERTVIETCMSARYRMLLSATPFVSVREFPVLLNVCAGALTYPMSEGEINDRYRKFNKSRYLMDKATQTLTAGVQDGLKLLTVATIFTGANGLPSAVKLGTSTLFSILQFILQASRTLDEAEESLHELNLKNIAQDAEKWVALAPNDRRYVPGRLTSVVDVTLTPYQMDLGLRWCVLKLQPSEAKLLGVETSTAYGHTGASRIGLMPDQWRFRGQALAWMAPDYASLDLATEWHHTSRTYRFTSDATAHAVIGSSVPKVDVLVRRLRACIKQKEKACVYTADVGAFTSEFLSATLTALGVEHIVAQESTITALPRAFNIDYYTRGKKAPQVYVALLVAQEGYDLFGVQHMFWVTLPPTAERFVQIRGRVQRAFGNDYLESQTAEKPVVHEYVMSAQSGLENTTTRKLSDLVGHALRTIIIPFLTMHKSVIESQLQKAMDGVKQDALEALKTRTNLVSMSHAAEIATRAVPLITNPHQLVKWWTDHVHLSKHSEDVLKLQKANEAVPAFARMAQHPTPDTEQWAFLQSQLAEIEAVSKVLFKHNIQTKTILSMCPIWPHVPVSTPCPQLSANHVRDDCALLDLPSGCETMTRRELNNHSHKTMRDRKKALKKENRFDQDEYREFSLSVERALRRIERQKDVVSANPTDK
jgi:DNA polymerase III delta prime subunit